MTTSTVIPCKRPKVTVEPNQLDHGSSVAACHVPHCGWTYPTNPAVSHAVKSDATEHATRHRALHRDAVPATRIAHEVEWEVYCDPCGGHRRTFGTRTDAEAWLAYHLSTEHGLVTCP